MGKDPEKKEYKQVQFLAWEIYTGPVMDTSYNGVDYAGIRLQNGGRSTDHRWAVLDQCIDIEARLEATKRALETALLWADKDESTLKIFMAPEFLYRGPAGAYINDLLDGWVGAPPFKGITLPPPFDLAWGGLIGGLKALAADAQFENWIFVFGTAIGAAFTGPQDDATAVNISFIQRGGPSRGNECYFVKKHLKSWMDFIRFNLDHPAFFDRDVRHDSRRDWPVLDGMMYDNDEMGGCLFSFPTVCRSGGTALRFGLEICLDHAQGYESSDPNAAIGRLARTGERVDIQLVPSCGMSLIERSLALAPAQGPRDTSYAFNCDGNASLDLRALGGHVQLWHQVTAAGGGYQVEALQDVQSIYDEPDQTPPPADDPKQSRHFGISDAVIDLSGRIQLDPEEPGIDLRRISPYTLWRSHEDLPAGTDPQIETWPKGLGYIRRLPPVPLLQDDIPGNNRGMEQISTVMTSHDFISKAKKIAKSYETLYIMGCFGAPMTESNKKRYCDNHPFNRVPARTRLIMAASADTFGFDCVGLIKGILWGWGGDTHAQYGGAKYLSNGVPDIGADTMINRCTGASDKGWDDILPGEVVWMGGHIGIYIGDGLAVECSPKWSDKVQITAVENIGSQDGYHSRRWEKHGKLPWIDYGVKCTLSE